MPVVTSALVAPSVAKMLSSCPPKWKPNDNTKNLFQAFAQAYAIYLDSWLRSIKVKGCLVSGGAAPPGGPLTGGMITAAPGSASASGYRMIQDVFTPPVFSVTMPDGSIRNGSYTPWLQAAVKVVSAEIDSKVKAWTTGWSALGLPVALGGVSAWIPATPVSPPAPGPWAGGTITPFLLSGFGGGSSLAQALVSNVRKTLEAKARATQVSVVTDTKGGTTTTQLVNGAGDSAALFGAFSAGFTTMFDSVLKVALLKDASGASGVGTSAPLTGSIVPGTGSLGLLVVDI